MGTNVIDDYIFKCLEDVTLVDVDEAKDTVLIVWSHQPLPVQIPDYLKDSNRIVIYHAPVFESINEFKEWYISKLEDIDISWYAPAGFARGEVEDYSDDNDHMEGQC